MTLCDLYDVYVTDECLEQMSQVLLLLLGCAVQCDHKERYINAIKGLQVAVQQAMVTHIQQVSTAGHGHTHTAGDSDFYLESCSLIGL